MITETIACTILIPRSRHPESPEDKIREVDSQYFVLTTVEGLAIILDAQIGVEASLEECISAARSDPHVDRPDQVPA